MIPGGEAICVIKESGFCHGVKTAVDTADASIKARQGEMFLFGDLVNNSQVMAEFRKKGYRVTTDLNEITPNAGVIVRAHGVPKSVFTALQGKAEVIDCTCVAVKKIHKIVEETDRTIFVIGKKNHPEVVGILGWCKTPGIVLESEADLLQINPQSPMCVVGQTTCNPDWWQQATTAIITMQPGALIHQTLCHATVLKARKATELAKKVHTMIVVGDKESANSTELFQNCANVNKNTIFVSNFAEFLEYNTPRVSMGIVGSASSPIQIVQEIRDYMTFENFLWLVSQEVAEGSERFFAEKLEKTNSVYVCRILEELREQHQGGKCLRGALICMGEIIANSGSKDYLPIALAYEIFQTAILIHDDIIDNSETRRGKQTIHTKYKDAHYGISRGVCVGDYGLFMATNIISRANIADATKVRLFQQFSQVQLRTLEGEIMDVTLPMEPIDPAINYEEYMQAVTELYRYKTAWYTLAGPLMIGAIVGGATDELLETLRQIAIPLGVAFQIKDDLLGMYANEAVLGKPATSDMEEKKQTLLYGYAVKHASPHQKSEIGRLYGRSGATPLDLQALRDIFTDTGAQQFCQDTIQNLARESLTLVESTAISDECKGLFRGLVNYLIVREK